MSSIQNVRLANSLTFKDSSIYSGQLIDSTNNGTSAAAALPHGYGLMQTKEGFTHQGYYKYGKSVGSGVFTAPNGDKFYGHWNANHKRDKKGLFVRASDGIQLIETYNDGKLEKRKKRLPPAPSSHYWLPSTSIPATGTPPSARVGHTITLTPDGNYLLIFGGEIQQSDGTTINSNELILLDRSNNVWMRPEMTGTIPPPMAGHTATLVGKSIVIVGGRTSGMEVNSTVYSLDVTTGVWSSLVKGYPMIDHTTTYMLSTHTLYILVSSSLFTLSLSNMQYIQYPINTPALKKTPRYFLGHTATAYNNEFIVVYGGRMPSSNSNEGKPYNRCINDLRILNIKTLEWNVINLTPPPPTPAAQYDWSACIEGNYNTPRADHTAILINDHYLYLFGGLTTCNPNLNIVDEVWLNDIQIIELLNFKYLSSPTYEPLPFPSPIAQHATLLIDDQLWSFGGKNASLNRTNEWSRLQLPTGGKDSKKTEGKEIGKSVEEKENQNLSPLVNRGEKIKLSGNSIGTGTIVNETAAGSGAILEMFKEQEGFSKNK